MIVRPLSNRNLPSHHTKTKVGSTKALLCCLVSIPLCLYAVAVYMFVGTGTRYVRKQAHGVASVVVDTPTAGVGTDTTQKRSTTGAGGMRAKMIPSQKRKPASSPTLSKTTMYVVSLQGVPGADKENEGRMDDFRREWAAACSSDSDASETMNIIEFQQCPGQLDDRRGFGLTRAYVDCFQKAATAATATDMNTQDGTEEFAVFLEDDARMFFPGFACNQTLRKNLWKSAPDDTFVLMLGGHSWQFPDETQQPPQVPTAQTDEYQYIHANFSYGTYAFAVRRDNLEALRKGYEWDLEHPPGVDYRGIERVSPDIALYEHGQRHGKRVYATHPLIIQHIAGYSNTWKFNRGKVLGNNYLPEEGIVVQDDEDDEDNSDSSDQEKENDQDESDDTSGDPEHGDREESPAEQEVVTSR